MTTNNTQPDSFSVTIRGIIEKNTAVVGLAQDYDDDNEPDLWQFGRGELQSIISAITEAHKKDSEEVDTKARLSELRMLTEWTIGDKGEPDYDQLHARHKRSYDDRIKQLEENER